jgi:protein-S-isoprenylcysteine O-methyltransferase Ste14
MQSEAGGYTLETYAPEVRRSEQPVPIGDATIPVARSRWMPPPLFLLYGLAGVVFHFTVYGPRLLRMRWTGGAVLVVGAALTLWGARTFAVAGTTIKPFERTTRLVVSGPFRFSRNPMYLGLVTMLLGSALALGTVGPWFAALALAVTLQLRFIRHEERALTASLGEPYERYRCSVRRWI